MNEHWDLWRWILPHMDIQSFCRMNQVCKVNFQLLESYDPLGQLLLQRAKTLNLPLGAEIAKHLNNDFLALLTAYNYVQIVIETQELHFGSFEVSSPNLQENFDRLCNSNITKFDIKNYLGPPDLTKLLIKFWNPQPSLGGYKTLCTATVNVIIRAQLLGRLEWYGWPLYDALTRDLEMVELQTGRPFEDGIVAYLLAQGDIVNAIMWLTC